MSEIKYPHITVKLTGENGNAFNLISKVTYALRRNGLKQVEIDEFVTEATSGDYDNVLQTCMRWVDVE